MIINDKVPYLKCLTYAPIQKLRCPCVVLYQLLPHAKKMEMAGYTFRGSILHGEINGVKGLFLGNIMIKQDVQDLKINHMQ